MENLFRSNLIEWPEFWNFYIFIQVSMAPQEEEEFFFNLEHTQHYVYFFVQRRLFFFRDDPFYAQKVFTSIRTRIVHFCSYLFP